MEREHTPTIIRAILATDHASIQLKVHIKFFVFQQKYENNLKAMANQE